MSVNATMTVSICPASTSAVSSSGLSQPRPAVTRAVPSIDLLELMLDVRELLLDSLERGHVALSSADQ